MAEQRRQCARTVSDGTRADWGGHRCGKPAKAQEVDPYFPDKGLQWWCAIHIPSVSAARFDQRMKDHDDERKQRAAAARERRIADAVRLIRGYVRDVLGIEPSDADILQFVEDEDAIDAAARGEGSGSPGGVG